MSPSALENAGLQYMLTGSMALNHYAQPRMTRDIDIVIAFFLKDLNLLPGLFGKDFYYSEEAARQAILHQSSFNVIHDESLIKIDFMIRKREDYRLVEFGRRRKIEISGQFLWIVSKEDLILSKLGMGARVPKRTPARRRREPPCHRRGLGIPSGVVSKIEPDRYADTGFSVKDTPPEVNARLFREMMARTGEERLVIGCRMAAAARQLVWSGIPRDLPAGERRALFLQRFHGPDPVLPENSKAPFPSPCVS